MTDTELHRCILTENDCYKQGRKITPSGIVVHSTGANNPALRRYVQPDDGLLGENIYGNHWNQPRPGGKSVCVHAFIGKLKDGSIAAYQTLPWDYRCWGCGSGSKGSCNESHIQFEICEDDLTSAEYLRAVYREAAELCAYLCRRYNIPVKRIVCHSEAHELGYASGHSDVMHWWPRHGLSMDTFRAEVERLLNENSEEEDVVSYEDFKAFMDRYEKERAMAPVSDWAAGSMEKAVKAGVFTGDENGDIQPQAPLTRQTAAILFDRLGLLN